MFQVILVISSKKNLLFFAGFCRFKENLCIFFAPKRLKEASKSLGAKPSSLFHFLSIVSNPRETLGLALFLL
jgi:hypothetical protein